MGQGKEFAAIVDGPEAPSRIVLVCEHAANAFPAPWGALGLTPEAQSAHVAWDPGALGLAKGLATRLDACLVHAPVSRLIHDLNRPPGAETGMPARSEAHDIPGNRAISAQDRADRVARVWLPFHRDLQAVIARRIAAGLAPVMVTVHSFTPVWHGQARAVEFGVIHDADATYANAVLAAAHAMTDLRAELNAPYSAADGVTQLLRQHAVPYALPHAMLEVRNDLIATPPLQDAMADRLAPVLAHALGAL
jgi:predicted N-formylglutamate amidohydrolase